MRIPMAFCAVTLGLAMLLGAQGNRPVPYSGDEWLSWKSSQRDSWVDGYIAGYGSGAIDACKAAEEIAPNPTARPGDENRESEFVTARCIKRVDSFDRYVRSISEGRAGRHAELFAPVLTDFYEHHPEHRKIPYAYLIHYLSDGNSQMANELFDKARRGEMKTNW